MATPEYAKQFANVLEDGANDLFGIPILMGQAIGKTYKQAADALRDLASQVESLQADAERYRWLKTSSWYVGMQPEFDYGMGESYDQNYGEILNNAIDEARKQS